MNLYKIVRFLIALVGVLCSLGVLAVLLCTWGYVFTGEWFNPFGFTNARAQVFTILCFIGIAFSAFMLAE